MSHWFFVLYKNLYHFPSLSDTRQVEAMVGSGRRRGEVMVEMGEPEEGRLLTVLIEANELVTQDKKMSVPRCIVIAKIRRRTQ